MALTESVVCRASMAPWVKLSETLGMSLAYAMLETRSSLPVITCTSNGCCFMLKLDDLLPVKIGRAHV